MRTISYLLLCLPLAAFAQDAVPAMAPTTPACTVLDSLKSVKKVPKGLPDRAFAEALDSSQCVDSFLKKIGENSAQGKKFRKALPDRQPETMVRLYGIKKLTPDEQKHIFFSPILKDSGICTQFADSLGLIALVGKDWPKKTTPFDTSAFLCKQALAPRIIPILDSVLVDTAAHRAKLLAYYPETWFDRYGTSASDEEKVRYATNPSLLDASHCSYADVATAEQLMRLGTPDNACKPYIVERWGAPILRMSFRKAYKPAVLASINKRLATANANNLDSLQGLIDTIEILFGDGESWEVLDSLESSLLHMIAKTPQAIRKMKEPTATMLLTAFDAQLTLMCDYPDITDRMVYKMIGDRASNEKPMPTPEELAALQACLAPDILSALQKAIQPYLNH